MHAREGSSLECVPQCSPPDLPVFLPLGKNARGMNHKRGTQQGKQGVLALPLSPSRLGVGGGEGRRQHSGSQSALVPPTEETFTRRSIRFALLSLSCVMNMDDSGSSRLGAAPFGAFSRQRLPLSGILFTEQVDTLSPTARENFANISDLAACFQPLRWTDTLTPSQGHKYGWVSSPADWDKYADPFKTAVAALPVLAVALELGEGDRVEYLTVAAHCGHAVTFPLLTLSTRIPGWRRRAELLPEELRAWLADPAVTILVVENPERFAQLLDGINCANLVDCTAVFLLYQEKGIIHPTFPIAKPDIAWLMTYATGYHHRPMEENKFRQLVGPHDYQHWPARRQPSWRPRSVDKPSPAEAFYLFFEAGALFAFMYRLLQHGVVYGGMAAVQADLPFRELISSFLQAVGLGAEEARTRDPLGLMTDLVTGPPAVPPFTSAETSVPPPMDTYDANFPPLVPPQAPPRETIVRGQDDGDAIDLQDEALVTELNQETVNRDRDGAGPVDPAHPGYFTQSQAMQLARPPSVEILGETCKSSHDHEDKKPTTSERRDNSQGDEPTVLPVPPPPGPPSTGGGRRICMDLRQKLERNNNYLSANVTVDLREKLNENKRESSFLPYDVRSHTRARTHAGAFAAEAAASVAPPVALPTPDPSLNFSQRIAARNRAGPPPPRPAASAGGPAAKKKKNLDIWALTYAERAWNPFMQKPLMHRRCEVCSSQHCSRFQLGTRDINCKKFKDHLAFCPSRRICDYRRCTSPQDHFTPACPALHQRCPRCGFRGHNAADGCDTANEALMAALREDFEEVANVGFHTQHRFGNPVWGFYPLPADSPRTTDEPFVDYVLLTDKTVKGALAFLSDLLAADRNQVDLPPALDHPSVFARAGCAQVAPAVRRGEPVVGTLPGEAVDAAETVDANAQGEHANTDGDAATREEESVDEDNRAD